MSDRTPSHPFHSPNKVAVLAVRTEREAEVSDLLAALHNPQTDIDWVEVLRSLTAPDGDQDVAGERWQWLGHSRDLLPSRKSYTLAQVGGVVSDEEANRDLAWLRALRTEAGKLGLRVESDDWGDSLYVVAQSMTLVQIGEQPVLASSAAA